MEIYSVCRFTGFRISSCVNNVGGWSSVEDALFSSSNDFTIILVATFNESSNVSVDLRFDKFLLELTSSFVYRWSSCSIRCSMLLSKLASGVAFGMVLACKTSRVHCSIIGIIWFGEDDTFNVFKSLKEKTTLHIFAPLYCICIKEINSCK